MGDNTWYLIGAYITGGISFILIWVYSFFTWGFLLGLMIGWLPAAIGAFILGLLWPIVLLLVLGLLVLIFR